MASRLEIKRQIRTLLGTSADDPQYSDTVLDPIVQQAVDSLVSSLQDANPDYLSTVVTLTADSATSRTYTFATQVAPVLDFAKWLEVRYTDQNGVALAECRLEEMEQFGSDYFAMIGPDEAPILLLSPDAQAGTALYFRYAYWPAALADDSSVPTGIPSRFQDVVALEALFAYGLGGEQRRPPELGQRWTDRRAQMLFRAGRRGVQPSRTRTVLVDL